MSLHYWQPIDTYGKGYVGKVLYGTEVAAAKVIFRMWAMDKGVLREAMANAGAAHAIGVSNLRLEGYTLQEIVK